MHTANSLGFSCSLNNYAMVIPPPVGLLRLLHRPIVFKLPETNLKTLKPQTLKPLGSKISNS